MLSSRILINIIDFQVLLGGVVEAPAQVHGLRVLALHSQNTQVLAKEFVARYCQLDLLQD